MFCWGPICMKVQLKETMLMLRNELLGMFINHRYMWDTCIITHLNIKLSIIPKGVLTMERWLEMGNSQSITSQNKNKGYVTKNCNIWPYCYIKHCLNFFPKIALACFRDHLEGHIFNCTSLTGEICNHIKEKLVS